MALGWNDLFARGSIVALELGYWRARTKLKASDFGIQETPEVVKVFSLGCHRLAPPDTFKELLAVHREARRINDLYSMPFGMIQGARFVPEAQLAQLLDGLDKLRRQHRKIVAEFLDRYEELKKEHLPIMRRALKHAAHSEEAADLAYFRLKTEYPSLEEVRDRFRFDWSVYAVAGPQTKAAAKALTDESGEVRQIVQQYVRQLRDELKEKLEAIRAIAARGGKLPETSAEACKELCERLDSMNVLGDVELRQSVNLLRSLINGASAQDMDKGFRKSLDEISSELSGSLKDAQAKAEATLTATGKRRISV